MAHFELKFAVAVESRQMIAGKGVAQDVLLPRVGDGVPAGESVQLSPLSAPVARANRGVWRVARHAVKELGERWVDGHMACAAGFAVLGENADDAFFQADVFPCETLDFIRANSGKKHDGDSRQAGSVVVCAGGVEEGADLLRGEDADALFFDALRFQFADGVFVAPASQLSCAEDAAQGEARFVALAGCGEGAVEVFRAVRRSDAAQTPPCEPGASFHEAASQVAQVDPSAGAAGGSRFESSAYRCRKVHRFSFAAQGVISRLNALFGAVQSPVVALQGISGQERCFQYVDACEPQHLQCGLLFHWFFGDFHRDAIYTCFAGGEKEKLKQLCSLLYVCYGVRVVVC